MNLKNTMRSASHSLQKLTKRTSWIINIIMRIGFFWQPKILTLQLMHDNTKDSNIHLHHTHIAKRLEWLSELISEMSEWDVSRQETKWATGH